MRDSLLLKLLFMKEVCFEADSFMRIVTVTYIPLFERK
jgi:hypothetical protein